MCRLAYDSSQVKSTKIKCEPVVTDGESTFKLIINFYDKVKISPVSSDAAQVIVQSGLPFYLMRELFSTTEKSRLVDTFEISIWNVKLSMFGDVPPQNIVVLNSGALETPPQPWFNLSIAYSGI